MLLPSGQSLSTGGINAYDLISSIPIVAHKEVNVFWFHKSLKEHVPNERSAELLDGAQELKVALTVRHGVTGANDEDI